MIETNVQPNQPVGKALPPIILASGSPRRKALLKEIGLAFTVLPPEVEEKDIDIFGLAPRQVAMHLAQAKGISVAQQQPQSLVIAADTIVVVGNDILGKPEDTEDALRMLSRLQDTTHSVFSAIAVFYQGKALVDVLETRVTMRALSEAEIRQYIATGEPMDKAGAYAIQGYGSLLVDRIEGCYFNVVGLSLILLDRLCKQMGLTLVF